MSGLKCSISVADEEGKVPSGGKERGILIAAERKG